MKTSWIPMTDDDRNLLRNTRRINVAPAKAPLSAMAR